MINFPESYICLPSNNQNIDTSSTFNLKITTGNAVITPLWSIAGLRDAWKKSDFKEISNFFSFLHFCLKIGLKVYAIFRELLYHLSSIVIHQTKPTTYDSHHPKWFQDRFIYNKDKWGVKKIVNPETPCILGAGAFADRQASHN